MSEKTLNETYISILPSLRRYLMRMMIRQEDVEDVLQETWLRTSRAKNEGIISPRSYLFRAARNIAFSEMNRKSKATLMYIEDLADPEVAADQVGVDEQVHSRIQMETFGRAVSSLPQKCRKVFLLKKLYGLSHREIADRLDISTNTVEVHLARGVARCAKFMRAEGYSPADLRVVMGTGIPAGAKGEAS